MGLRDLFRRKSAKPAVEQPALARREQREFAAVAEPGPVVEPKRTPPKKTRIPAVPQVQKSTRTETAPAETSPSASSLTWLPQGESFVVQGRTVTGGMVYVGSGAPSVDGSCLEPALVDADLPVNWQNPDWNGDTLGYWPSYDRIDARARAAYLGWLADGRSQAGANIGYVFIFFYGLERRLLVDIAQDKDHSDRDQVLAEIRRLIDIYGDNGSFGYYAENLLRFMEALDYADAETPPVPWDPEYRHWELPPAVGIGVGRFVAKGLPIPSAWALSYLRYHPNAYLRTPSSRCHAEFDELFRSRYEGKFGDGLKVRAPKKKIGFSYRPASGGIQGEVSVTLDSIPDIATIEGPINKLKDIAADCEDALDAYSRFLGRRPDEADSAAAAALLPDELLKSFGGSVFDAIRLWTRSALDGRSQAVVPLDEIVEYWSPGRTEKLAKRDAVSVAALLGKIGVGIEPDVRFGAATPKPGTSAVLFPLLQNSPVSPSSTYTAAMSLVHFTAVVAAADGDVSESERKHLARHIEEVLGLDSAETARLEAHLSFLTTAKLGMAGMKKRIDALSETERVSVGRFLVDVAAADGVVSPEEISVLTKLFVRLGLDEADVFRQVHNLGSGETGPVTVSDGGAETRWRVPDPDGAQTSTGPIALDPAKVQARLAETAHVTALLADIFSEDDSPSGGAQGASPSAADAPITPIHDAIGTMDQAHSALAIALGAEAEWSRVDAEELADSLGLPLLDGALDRINEEAMDECGEPLIEGDEPLVLNSYAIEEMLS